MTASEPWAVESYTDEAGFQERISGMMDRSLPGEYGNAPESMESTKEILGHLTYDRYTGRAAGLRPFDLPEGNDPGEWSEFLGSSTQYAGAWLWPPRKDVEIERVSPGAVDFRCGVSRVFLYPFGGEPVLLEPETSEWRYREWNPEEGSPSNRGRNLWINRDPQV